MKSYRSYISRYLVYFIAFFVALLFLNGIFALGAFRHYIVRNTDAISPSSAVTDVVDDSDGTASGHSNSDHSSGGTPRHTYYYYYYYYYALGMLVMDSLALFGAYYLLSRKVLAGTKPIITAIKGLSDGTPSDLSVPGELSDVADSLNQASLILRHRNEARANWVSGVSHDIRTPLSMIMGYAERIAHDEAATPQIREQAEIVKRQSIKIRDLVQDLNLVSKLEYEMQPLHKESVRLSKLVRSYAADLLNAGVPDTYALEIAIAPTAETALLDCDARLISRAIDNLVQNSIRHNPQGCEITISLTCQAGAICLSVTDNGVGQSEEKLRQLKERHHYMNSTDERLDLQHGLGLLLVRQIVIAHGGTVDVVTAPQKGWQTTMFFPLDGA